MNTFLFKRLILVFLTLNLTACGTIISLSSGNYAVYGGVITDFSAIGEGGFLSILATIDLPLSFVLDTLMLPVTLNQ